MSDFPHRVSACYMKRHEIGVLLNRSGVRRSQYWRQDSTFGDRDVYCFKKPQHAVLLKLYLDEGS